MSTYVDIFKNLNNDIVSTRSVIDAYKIYIYAITCT